MQNGRKEKTLRPFYAAMWKVITAGEPQDVRRPSSWLLAVMRL